MVPVDSRKIEFSRADMEEERASFDGLCRPLPVNLSIFAMIRFTIATLIYSPAD
jgi:hypothetical protein